MKVSVLMTVFNEELQWIKESIDSVLNQTYKNVEIIIVIDNPNDKELLKLIVEYAKKNSCITYIQNERNMGLALSLNVAFKASTGSLIARMDADDVCDSRRFETQVNFLLENDHYQLISTSCNYIDENGKIIGTRRKKNIKNYNDLKKSLEIQNFLIHPSWMMRKSLFEELAGYRNFQFSQDYDFILRAISNGYKIYNSDEVLLNYRVRESSISVSKGYKQYIIAKYILECYFARKETGKDDFTLEHLNSYIDETLNTKNEKVFMRSKKYLTDFKNADKILIKLRLLLKIFSNPYSRKQFLDVIKLRKIEKVGGIN